MATIVPGNSVWIIRANRPDSSASQFSADKPTTWGRNSFEKLSRFEIPGLVEHQIEQTNFDVAAECLPQRRSQIEQAQWRTRDTHVRGLVRFDKQNAKSFSRTHEQRGLLPGKLKAGYPI